MYKRLAILTIVIVLALAALGRLGYRSIEMRAEGMQGRRLGEFASVAEQIRLDVKRKLNEFFIKEQKRPYTHYQYDYVPEGTQASEQPSVLRSPIGQEMQLGFAYGYFQVEPDGRIITPYSAEWAGGEPEFRIKGELAAYISTLRQKLLPRIDQAGYTTVMSYDLELSAKGTETKSVSNRKAGKAGYREAKRLSKSLLSETLQSEKQKTMVYQQQRQVAMQNQMRAQRFDPALMAGQQSAQQRLAGDASDMISETRQIKAQAEQIAGSISPAQTRQVQSQGFEQAEPSRLEMIQVRVEPFAPVVVEQSEDGGIFGGQVYLIRHVQVEERHIMQGFRLAEDEVLAEVRKSAQVFTRKAMVSQISVAKQDGAAYSATLDFGFSRLVLNLFESEPGWIAAEISTLRRWYIGILAVVFVVIAAGLVSLWLNARSQMVLARKKDDFISAVSHELRTPLTSIRMYSEMLENKWVKSQDKVNEYYRNMRHESERLTRLVENVLDFSRIQKGRKKYGFEVAEIDRYVADTAEMMQPYAQRNGFEIVCQLEASSRIAFDRDAVTQIVVNLLDNAVKYGGAEGDKQIIVRTAQRDGYVLIEVEDHGPGISHREKKKIFEKFYRIAPESTRSTNGTGLGLALVKHFAEAHNGFVKILNAAPRGTIFRVGLAAQR